MIRTHKVYIVEKNGGAPIQREVIFPEELERVIRPLIVELTVCRETFLMDAKEYREEDCPCSAEMSEERAQRVNLVLQEAPPPIGRGLDALLPEPDQFNTSDLNGKSTEGYEIPYSRDDLSSDQIDFPEPGMGGEKA